MFIVPGVCRYAVNQVFKDRAVVNVLDYRIDTTGSILDREDAISDFAGIIINEWSDQMLVWQADTLIAQSVSWVDLDSATGSTGERSVTSQETWPQAGAETGSAPLVSNVAMLVRKQAAAQRGARTGRMYLCGVGENRTTDAEPNRLIPADVTSFNTLMAAFLGNTNQSGGGPVDYQSEMVVVTTLTRDLNGRPLTGIGREVQALAVDPLLATQRRRLRG